MLPSYFDYIFVNRRLESNLKPESSPKFLSTLGPNPTRKARSDLQLWFYLHYFTVLSLEIKFNNAVEIFLTISWKLQAFSFKFC